LIAFDIRLVTTWSRRLLSQVPTTATGARTVSVQPTRRRLLAEPRAHLVDDLRDVDLLHVQLQPAGGDARHVEQLVDQAMQARRLRIDLLDLGDDLGRAVDGVAARDARQVRDLQLQRRQRRAQLVRRDRQEVVAQHDRLAQRLLGALLVVDVGGGRDPADDVAVFVALGHGARDVPPVAAVGGALDADLAFERARRRAAPSPSAARLDAVVRVQALPERFVGDRARRRSRSTRAPAGSSS
jgi:hypothetical protein